MIKTEPIVLICHQKIIYFIDFLTCSIETYTMYNTFKIGV